MKKFLLLFCLCLCLALLCGIAAAEPVNGVDMTGRAFTLEAPAARVVALTPSDVEILYALGAGDTLVGRGEYCNYPAECLDVPAVNSGAGTNLEQVLALEPQVVIMATMAQTVEQVEALEKAGVTVVVSDAQNIAGVYEAIRLIGTVVGKDAEAEALVAEMQAGFAEMAPPEGAPEASVYFEVSPLAYGLWTAGPGSFMDEIAAMIGLRNAFGDVEGSWAAISEEQVLERDPDYIVTISMYFGEGPTPVEEICAREGWDALQAVKNGRVFNADNDCISRPGPRLVQAAQALYQFVYGEPEAPEAEEEIPAA